VCRQVTRMVPFPARKLVVRGADAVDFDQVVYWAKAATICFLVLQAGLTVYALNRDTVVKPEQAVPNTFFGHSERRRATL
jgi:hypothetical protein